MLSVMAQLYVFGIGALLTVGLVFGIVLPFVDTNPRVIIPGVIGGVVGMFCSVPVVASADLTDIWSFCIALGTPVCIGLALGFAVGLML